MKGKTLIVRYEVLDDIDAPKKQQTFLTQELKCFEESDRTPRHVSLYIKNPFLIEERKFVIKIYALMHGINP